MQGTVTIAGALVAGLLTAATIPTPIYVHPDDLRIPAHWEEVEYTPLVSPHRAERVTTQVSHALATYSDELLREALTEVQILGTLEWCDQSIHSMSSSRKLYIAAAAHGQPLTAAEVWHTVHWQFAIVLFNQYHDLFDDDAWAALLPRRFEYVDDCPCGAPPRSSTWDPRLHAEGFLHEYAQDSIGRDFASIAAQLFRNDRAFWRAVSIHPKLRRKVEFVMDFYEMVDPRMTRRFFRRVQSPS